MENWIIGQNQNDSLVVSSRIRLARNVKDIAFPNRLDDERSKSVIKDVEDAFYKFSNNRELFKTIYMWNEDKTSQEAFLEKHLVSHKLLTNSSKAAFIIDSKETISIMINEEDHLRVQCITAGLNLTEAFEMAIKVDDLLEENLDFAFNEKFGYITTCPTNIGTGMRASAMVHLPALAMNEEITGVFKALTQVGMTLRGLYGEGSQALGNFYQISNQVTLGLQEEEIINNLTAVINKIITQEKLSREHMLRKYKYELDDKIFRSLGLLKSAILINNKECLYNLSNVRMGVEMGIIKEMDIKILNSLLVATQPASLQKNLGVKLSERERDLKRAEIIKEILK
ncbi:MAG: protein arginine kinase [Clostridiaceae bacterium]|nr:protein arginine kinase [Clostridiaceae bacterium]